MMSKRKYLLASHSLAAQSNKKTLRLCINFSLILGLLTLTGCAQMGIKPWVKPYERQNLADPIMSANRHGIANRHIAHVLEARESARGAEGSGGGGCGCN